MDHAALDQFLALNRHLEALDAAGVPLDLGPEFRSGGDKSLGAALERESARVAVKVGRGSTLAAALDDASLPPHYRAAMLANLDADDPTAALDVLHAPAVARREMGQSLCRTLSAPLIILTLAYFATIYLCLFVAPTFGSLYEQFGERPALPTRVLLAARDWLPVWATLAPAIVVIGIWAWRRGGKTGSTDSGRWRMIPGVGNYLTAVGHANFAGALARLTQRDVPLADALQLAAKQAGNQSLADVETLPPLLYWALAGRSAVDGVSAANSALAANLRFASGAYRRLAQRKAARWRFAVPALLGGLIGGVVVLCYGLSVFVPTVNLLEHLSIPRN